MRKFIRHSGNDEDNTLPYRRNNFWALLRAIFTRSESLMAAWSYHSLASTTSS